MWCDQSNTRTFVDAPAFEAGFELTDHRGMVRSQDDFAGRWMLVFFGFTYCPDVCPTPLSDISAWLEDFGPEAEGMNVIFITVDPERDTVEAMADYVSYFHPSVRGWTGPGDEIARAADGFRVRYEKIPTDSGDYTMNHTASVFLFDETGRLSGPIDYHEPREFAVPKIRQALEIPSEEPV
ncbi:SCO family protein [Pseudooctadecabacter sp.]|uniref:SCO family protein n=1 Tax=Pseudooctadecabacter sp. TaxID=1966338 RepID=UPI0035C826DA